MAVHVTPKKDKWQVKSAGAKKAYRIVDTQKEGIEIGKTVAKNKKTDIKIHSKKGTIRDVNFYGDKK